MPDSGREPPKREMKGLPAVPKKEKAPAAKKAKTGAAAATAAGAGDGEAAKKDKKGG